MTDFWDRKRQELYPGRREPVNVSSPVGPWWSVTGEPARTTQQPAQRRAEVSENIIDGHDISKASILKGDAEECPRCPRDPRTGIAGNMYRPSRNAALRCFDCGFIDGRDMGEGQSRVATVQGKTQFAKQTSSGGAVVGNFHGNITSLSEAVGRIR